MVGLPGILTSKAQQVAILLHIVLARYVMDMGGGIPEPLSQEFRHRPSMGNVGSVLTAMDTRLKALPSRPTSPEAVAKSCMQAAPNPDPWAENLYLIIFMGSLTFAQALCASNAIPRSVLGPRAKSDHILRGASLVSGATRVGH